MRGLRGLLHLVARPVRATRGQGEMVLQPYRGYGTQDEVSDRPRVPAARRSVL